ncbi:DUF3265 domain-containing protein [Vibrio diabolicus]|nr:DUF3265 domain-containing protein [Vibrio diabolicus]
MIPHAWHFWFGFSSVFRVSNLSVLVAWLTP